MKKFIIIFMILILPAAILAGGFSKVGTAAAQFLKIGVGARAMGMAGSFTAVGNDISTIYWNPAGIANLDRFSIGVTHTEWFADISHDFAGAVLPLSTSDFLAVQAIMLNSGEQEVTTVAQPDGAGIFYDVQDLSIGLSYARQLTDRFSVGVTAKYVVQNLYNVQASSLTLDVGSYLKTGFHNLVIGMAISNFGGSMQLDGRDLITIADINPYFNGNFNPDARLTTQEYPLPLIFRVGLSMDVVGSPESLYPSEDYRFTLAAEGTHLNDNNERFNIGGEISWTETVFVRAGYKFNYDTEKWTLGLGVNVPIGNQKVGFDFAYIQFESLGNVSQFSVQFQL